MKIKHENSFFVQMSQLFFARSVGYLSPYGIFNDRLPRLAVYTTASPCIFEFTTKKLVIRGPEAEMDQESIHGVLKFLSV